MTPTSLRRDFERLGVNRWVYGIGRERDEAYCLVREGDDWLVFYSERGQRNDVTRHAAKEDACADLYRRVTSDPTTTQRPGTRRAADPD
jgi:hypothetical protein